jgi:hypothetical protein
MAEKVSFAHSIILACAMPYALKTTTVVRLYIAAHETNQPTLVRDKKLRGLIPRS